MEKRVESKAKSRELEAYREYVEVHRRYMNTNMFSEEMGKVRRELEIARQKYVEAVKENHPTWVVM